MQLFVRDLNGCSVAVLADTQQNVGQLKVRAFSGRVFDVFFWGGEIRVLRRGQSQLSVGMLDRTSRN